MQVEVDSADQRVETLVSTLAVTKCFFFFNSPSLPCSSSSQLLLLAIAAAYEDGPEVGPFWSEEKKISSHPCPLRPQPKLGSRKKMTGRDSVARSTFLQKTRFAVLDATTCIEKC